MPESVRDRPTKSHEYLFLLAKSQRYFYDADAVKEPFADERMGNPGKYTWKYHDEQASRGGATLAKAGGVWNSDRSARGRNRRSVWSLGPESFSGAHFAVMPKMLVEPCILAGSKVGDTVLDPFAGSGTVGVVALRHNRQFVGCELNPEYAAMARRRIEASRQKSLAAAA